MQWDGSRFEFHWTLARSKDQVRKLRLYDQMMLRLAWIFGLLSTRDYRLRMRQKRFGPAGTESTDCALQRLERPLFEDRLAMILFLLGSMIFAYTFLNRQI